MMFLCIAGVAKIVFLLWVGLSAGDRGDNRYGPPPVSLLTTPPAPPSPTATV